MIADVPTKISSKPASPFAFNALLIILFFLTVFKAPASLKSFLKTVSSATFVPMNSTNKTNLEALILSANSLTLCSFAAIAALLAINNSPPISLSQSNIINIPICNFAIHIKNSIC